MLRLKCELNCLKIKIRKMSIYVQNRRFSRRIIIQII